MGAALESIGKRIQGHRLVLGWTQQQVADRVAISRVAVSHIESDLTIPGERTITLLAGLFKVTPQALVDGTTYPEAKAERLPLAAASYTPLELDLALMENDLAWAAKFPRTLDGDRVRAEVRERWLSRLMRWAEVCVDPEACALVAAAKVRLREG